MKHMQQRGAIRMGKVVQPPAVAELEEKVAGLLRSLSDEEVAMATPELVERARHRMQRNRNRLSAHRVELEESRRILAETEAALEREHEAEKKARKSQQVDDISIVQRKVRKLENRLRSYQQNIPAMEETLRRLEAEAKL